MSNYSTSYFIGIGGSSRVLMMLECVDNTTVLSLNADTVVDRNETTVVWRVDRRPTVTRQMGTSTKGGRIYASGREAINLVRMFEGGTKLGVNFSAWAEESQDVFFDISQNEKAAAFVGAECGW